MESKNTQTESHGISQRLAGGAFMTMNAIKESHEMHVESIGGRIGDIGLIAGFAVELKSVVDAARKGDAILTEEEALKALGSIGGAVIGAEAGGAAGTAIAPGPGTFVLGAVGGLGGAHYGEMLMTHLTRQMHEEYGENTTIAVGMVRHALAKLEPYHDEALAAIHQGIDKLEHPQSQRLLEETRDAIRQTQAAHEVARNVDIDLAAPVLNVMQKMGGVSNVTEAAQELAKLGPVSDITYGKAASDMAMVMTMGDRLLAHEAADVLDKGSAGHIVPQFEIRASTESANGSLAQRAENGDLGAQHALMSRSSLVFSPRNEAASSRLSEIVHEEMSHSESRPDWKRLEASLQAENRAIAEVAAERVAQSATVQTTASVAVPSHTLER